MATKTAAKKGTSSRSTAARKTSASASKKIIHSVQASKGLDAKTQARRFGILYVVFACTTLIFAAMTIYLYKSNVELEAKYESIEACIREGVKCDFDTKDETETVSIDADVESEIETE